MWNVKTNVIPVIIGKLERLKIIQKIPEQHTGEARNQGTTKKKKTSILVTAHIEKYQRFNIGNSVICTAVRFPTDMVFFREYKCKYPHRG
jgi:hypothetical protein